MNRAVFLDRDGTINKDKGYLYKIEDFEFIDGAVEALRSLQQLGFMLFIITNQSGIARGYYCEDDFNELNKWMLSKLHNSGIFIQKVYYCPHLPDADVLKYRQLCDCRKPDTGLFLKAISEYQISLSYSWAIGDKLRDCSICQKSDCRGILIGSNEKEDIIEEVKNGSINNIQYANDLYTAAKIIEKENRK